ncbi:MAG TPA: histidinol-phosphate transaminase [Egicoccus sp.]|nr:histidinol-phosphate transaminase [Egicoccus sp.]HSK21894.1 histidinol-phosphate transaminase [Egicoccus sp.]
MSAGVPPRTAAERLPVRTDLADVEPYGAPQLDVPVRLNTNETADLPPAGYLDEVARRITSLQLNRYPDRPHHRLREALARRLGLTAAQVWAANGSNEILQQLLQAYGGPDRRAVYVRPGYSMYPELCRTSLTPAVEVDLDDDFRLTPDVARAIAAQDPDLVLVPSPNNPVGTPVGHDAIRTVHDATRALVVVDEAYVEFGAPDASVLDLVGTLPRLVVVRTFSKAFRLAGLRLGYLAAAEWVVDDVQKVRLPYHLDAIKQVAGLVALEQEADFLDHRQQVADERDRVAAALADLGGVEVWPSAANFLLFRTAVDDLFTRLLDQGVLVRDFSSKPRLAGCLRVTIGTPTENDAFLAALRHALA